MTTVRSLIQQVQGIINSLNTLSTNISREFTTLTNVGSTDIGSIDLTFQKEIRDMHDEANAYDREFEEEEAASQALGGKTRMQTLQEFVLLFFFVAYGIFTASIVLNTYARGQHREALKIVGIMALLLLLIVCFIIQLA
jgi:hypothetical protein